MSTLAFVTGLAYLLAATLFVVGLHRMRAPATARRGNQVSACGMAIAVAATAVFALVESGGTLWGWLALVLGLIAGGLYGVLRARRVKMTDIPQLVSLFNAVGGGAAAAVAVAAFALHPGGPPLSATVSVPIVLDVLIGAVTFSGSLIAAGKLQGIVPGRPLTFRGSRLVVTDYLVRSGWVSRLRGRRRVGG
jgi:NAD(P) transhydrogenase subunit beta